MSETEPAPASGAAEPAAGLGFWRRNRDELILEAIGGLVLALLVSFAISWIDQSREEERSARDEALSNSLFVRQAVMSERELLPFSSLYLADAQLSGLTLAGAEFSDADLTGAELKESDLTGADLSEAVLVGADLSEAVLVGTNLAEADLTGADLTAADLTGASLADVVWEGSFYLEGAPPVGVDLDGLPAEALAESDADADDD
ncbi:pentapeptide repeat-containing protein [Demequina sp. NBRC 110052]|uniref:pentapeptide repeat-containing protein n=1 Tax=Demequina sp. NBRC 110052 TaxID=1570341 RepID=UPI000A0310F1|nr:pentapeptide repeat-containing protein [Demequina sp. NBRC 110052]